LRLAAAVLGLLRTFSGSDQPSLRETLAKRS
jgi:hypothetical protein